MTDSFTDTLKELVGGVNAARAKKDASATMLACAALGGWCADASEDIVALVEALTNAEKSVTHISEYWNGSRTDGAMADALDEILTESHGLLNELRAALSRLEDKP